MNGFRFECAHWCNGGCNGKSEHFTKGLKEYYDSLKEKFDPSLPFFHVQHPHPRGTVHGKAVWGQDDGMSTQILSTHPNAIAFSGHSHTSLIDERSIWQGAFTSVGCGTLRDVSVGTTGILSGLEGGCENARTPKSKDSAVLDAQKAMTIPDRMNCRQGQFVRVYADRVVFSRREFVTDATLCDDLVMPLPAAESRPFAFEPRAAKAAAPSFAADAKLEVRKTKGKLRGGKGKKTAEVWEIVIPTPVADKAARVSAYEITATGPDGTSKVFGLMDPMHRFPLEDPRFAKPNLFRVACSRLPAEGLTFSVRAVSSWGKKSAPLVAKV